MAREIIVDEDTLVGFSYPLQQFYITNKKTTTYRETEELTKEVVDIVAPSNTISLEDLTALKENMETLTSLSYTLDDTGAYISTIQLNTYKENPLAVNFVEKKIYIMNTNIIFDLTLNEAPSYRIDYLISYYRNTHGLMISQQEMQALYDLLLSYYAPRVYNEVQATPTENGTYTLTYNNVFAVSSYTDKNIVIYRAIVNPNNTSFSIPFKKIENKNKIHLATPLSSPLGTGETIFINSVPYKVLNSYTNIINIKEEIPNYSYPYYKAFLVSSITNILSVDRETKTIALQELPSSLAVGDVIEITGTDVITATSITSADGVYTISSIDTESTSIVVEETPLTSYTQEGSTYAQLFTRTPLGNITLIEDSVATLETALETPLQPNSLVQVTEQDNTGVGRCTCESSTTTTLTLTNCPSYAPQYEELVIPSPIVNINTTHSNSKNFPEGEFTVDSFEQAKQYISTYHALPNNYIPSYTIRGNFYKEVPTQLDVVVGEITTMDLLGLFSYVYES